MGRKMIKIDNNLIKLRKTFTQNWSIYNRMYVYKKYIRMKKT